MLEKHLPLRPTLFWETNLKELNYQKDAQFIERYCNVPTHKTGELAKGYERD